MKAILLAAGRATRLGDLSRSTPKCLHEVGGQTLLDRLVGQLRRAGVDEILINTHHLSRQVEAHVANSNWHSFVETVYEPELLGTLGTLRANIDFLSSDGAWILHADNFIPGELDRLGCAFDSRPREAWGVLLTFRTSRPKDCGVVTTDSGQILTGFFEKIESPPTNLASAATMILDARAMDLIRESDESSNDLSRDLLPQLAGKLLVAEHPQAVIDIGTLDGLAEARRWATASR